MSSSPVCSCDVGFTCSRCTGTPFDPAYMDSDPEPVTEEQFEDLLLERHRSFPIIMLGEAE